MNPDPQPEHPQPWRMTDEQFERLGEAMRRGYGLGTGTAIVFRDEVVELAVRLGIVKPCEAEPGERVHARPSEETDFEAWWNHRVLSGADGDDDAITLADVRAAWEAATALREQREAGTRTEGGEKLAALADAPRLPEAR